MKMYKQLQDEFIKNEQTQEILWSDHKNKVMNHATKAKKSMIPIFECPQCKEQIEITDQNVNNIIKEVEK